MPVELRPVYNFEVADVHCYFANGVLVHNCDAMTLGLMRIRKGGLLRLAGDKVDWDENLSLPMKRAYY